MDSLLIGMKGHHWQKMPPNDVIMTISVFLLDILDFEPASRHTSSKVPPRISTTTVLSSCSRAISTTQHHLHLVANDQSRKLTNRTRLKVQSTLKVQLQQFQIHRHLWLIIASHFVPHLLFLLLFIQPISAFHLRAHRHYHDNNMASMLRSIRGGARGSISAFANTNINRVGTSATTSARSAVSRLMGTQSGDDAKPPTALATLYLEDGSKFVGRSFGSHESVDGEVRLMLRDE